MVREKLTGYDRDVFLCITPVIIRGIFYTDLRCNSWNYIRQRIISRHLYSNKLTKIAFNYLTSISYDTTEVFKITFIPHRIAFNFGLDLSTYTTITKRSEEDVSLGSFIFDNKKDANRLCYIILYEHYNVYSQTIMDYIFK